MPILDHLQSKPKSSKPILSPVQRKTALQFYDPQKYQAASPAQTSTKKVLQAVADGLGGKDGAYNERSYKAKTTFTLDEGGSFWRPSDYRATHRSTKATNQGDVIRNYSWNKPGTKPEPEPKTEEKPSLRTRISEKTPDIIEHNASLKANLWKSEDTEFWNKTNKEWTLLSGPDQSLVVQRGHTEGKGSVAVEADLKDGKISATAEASAKASLFNGAYKLENGPGGSTHTATVELLSGEAKGSATLEGDILKGQINGTAKAEVSAYLVNAEYKFEAGPVSGGVQGSVGAEAQGEVGFTVDLREGTLGGQVGGEAFAGGKIEGDIGVGKEGVGEAKMNGGLTYGIGAEFSAEMKVEAGKVKVDYDIGATLGVGVDLGFEAEVDVQGIATSAVNNPHIRNAAVKAAVEIHEFGSNVRDLGAGLKDFGSNAKQNAGNLAKRLWGG